MNYIIPTTREEAIGLLTKLQRRKQAKTKYDMLIGGLVCCNNAEFSKCTSIDKYLLLTLPCEICQSYEVCDISLEFKECRVELTETLSKKWNANLYN